MTPKQIINAVARITGIPYGRIACSMRIKGTGDARALAVWGIRKARSDVRQSDIADLLNQSQGSISRTVDRAQGLLDSCPKFRRMAAQLEAAMASEEVAA
jgi:hypothetical protein